MINIQTKSEFIKFLEEELLNSPTWRNNDLKTFLEAMISYTEDIQGYYQNTGQETNSNEASWKLFADIIKGATIYE